MNNRPPRDPPSLARQYPTLEGVAVPQPLKTAIRHAYQHIYDLRDDLLKRLANMGDMVATYISSLNAGPDTTKVISGAIHGLGTAALVVVVYDDASPRNAIQVSWTVDALTFDVTITFATAQSNYYVVIK